jgi:hypothetical protein
MKKYALPQIGLAVPLRLEAQLTVLRIVAGAPTVFLVDEYHEAPACIEQNIVNALILIPRAGIDVVGVEGFEGGYQYDDYNGSYTQEYIPGNITEEKKMSTHPEFAQAMKEDGRTVVGVDCRGLDSEIVSQIDTGDYTGAVKDHPNQKRRSEHMIKTLFLERARVNGTGALLLNAGRNHIDDIKQWIDDNTIDAKAGTPASYIRIRSTAYPNE